MLAYISWKKRNILKYIQNIIRPLSLINMLLSKSTLKGNFNSWEETIAMEKIGMKKMLWALFKTICPLNMIVLWEAT